MSGELRWGVFVRDPRESPDWEEWHRWSGDDLVELDSQDAAGTRAAEIAGRHPDWDVEARQTSDPLPGPFREAFRELLP